MLVVNFIISLLYSDKLNELIQKNEQCDGKCIWKMDKVFSFILTAAPVITAICSIFQVIYSNNHYQHLYKELESLESIARFCDSSHKEIIKRKINNIVNSKINENNQPDLNKKIVHALAIVGTILFLSGLFILLLVHLDNKLVYLVLTQSDFEQIEIFLISMGLSCIIASFLFCIVLKYLEPMITKFVDLILNER